MADAPSGGRARQRLRTRKHLLEAATRLVKAGRSPTLEEVAEEALVSRATAYRYFPSTDALMVEAALDFAFPAAEPLFAGGPADPAERVILAEQAVDAMVEENEVALRLMLINSLKLSLAAAAGEGRQNRRVPLIEAALAPAAERLDELTTERLTAILALIIGTEARLVFKDVLGLDRTAAADAKAWAIRTLVEAALRESVSDDLA